MNGIDLLLKEHQNILTFTDYLRSICCDILEGKEVDTETFRDCLDFGRTYADKHHHGKEEKILFRYMLEKLGTVAEKLVRQGMLVEHDLGRYHMGELEKALNNYDQVATTANKLDIILNAAGYADLLRRHIEKEDAVCFSFASRMLSDADKRQIDDETKQFEIEEEQGGIQEKYLSWLKSKSSL